MRIRLQPRSGAAYYNRGNAYVRLKQYRQAVSDYDQTIRLNPQNANARFNRGLIYQHVYKDRSGAVADYRAAYKLQPGNSKYEAQLRSLGLKP